MYFLHYDKVVQHFEVVRFLYDQYQHNLMCSNKFNEIVKGRDILDVYVVSEPTLFHWSAISVVKKLTEILSFHDGDDYDDKKEKLMVKIRQMEIPENLKLNLTVTVNWFMPTSPNTYSGI